MLHLPSIRFIQHSGKIFNDNNLQNVVGYLWYILLFYFFNI